MDVWNYRGDGSWSFVALKRPGDERLFCARNNTTGRLAYSRACLKRRGNGEWYQTKMPSDDFIVNPRDPVKSMIPIVDFPSVMDLDDTVSKLFDPWYVIVFPKPLDMNIDAEQIAILKESALIFRKNSAQTGITKQDAAYLGIALASQTDAMCLSTLLEVEYYDPQKGSD